MDQREDANRSPKEDKRIVISSSLLIMLNVLTFFVGLGITGGATYIWTNSGGGLIQGVSMQALIVAIVIGALIIFLSFAGIYGAVRRNKIILIIFSIFVFIILACEVIASVLLARYFGLLGTVPSGDMISKTLNDFIFSVYDKCCYQNKSHCVGYLPSDNNYCYPVYKSSECVQDGLSACYSGTAPVVGNEVCVLFSSGDLFGVADSSTGYCGAGNPNMFLYKAKGYVGSQGLFIYLFLGFSLGVEFLVVLFSGIIVFHRNASVSSAIIERDQELAEFAFNNPLQTDSFSREDQIIHSRASISSHNSARSSVTLSTRAMSYVPRGHVPSRVVDIDIGGRTVSIDEESGLQVAKPVDL